MGKGNDTESSGPHPERALSKETFKVISRAGGYGDKRHGFVDAVVGVERPNGPDGDGVIPEEGLGRRPDTGDILAAASRDEGLEVFPPVSAESKNGVHGMLKMGLKVSMGKLSGFSMGVGPTFNPDFSDERRDETVGETADQDALGHGHN